MGKVIKFPFERAVQRDSERFLKVADMIDAVIKNELMSGRISGKEIAGLLAHRLGALMAHVSDEERQTLLELCEKIMRAQANTDRGAG